MKTNEKLLTTFTTIGLIPSVVKDPSTGKRDLFFVGLTYDRDLGPYNLNKQVREFLKGRELYPQDAANVLIKAFPSTRAIYLLSLREQLLIKKERVK